MRSEAYKLTGFTAVVSALGFMLRWLQNMRIIDTETGLAVRGTGISGLVIALIVVILAALGFAAFYMLRNGIEPQTPGLALTGKTIVHTIVNMIPAGLMALSGLVQLIQADEYTWTSSELGIRRILAVATMVAAYALVLMVNGARKPEKVRSGRTGAVLMLIFGAVWLIAVYKSAATDPVVWRFAVEVLGICAALMAFFYVSGYFFDVPNTKTSIFFCETAAFLCIMTCIDEHTLGEALCLSAVALLMLIWGFTLTNNFFREPEPEPTGAHLEPEDITFDDFTVDGEAAGEPPAEEAFIPQPEEIFAGDEPEHEEPPEEEIPETVSILELELQQEEPEPEPEPEDIVGDIIRDYHEQE